MIGTRDNQKGSLAGTRGVGPLADIHKTQNFLKMRHLAPLPRVLDALGVMLRAPYLPV